MSRTAAWLEALQALLPQGAAWTRAADATLTKLLHAFARGFARLDARAEALIEEADPRTALELLDDWERVVGLPDACTTSGAQTVAERRAAIVARLTARGGQSIGYLTGLAAQLGYTIAIDEPRPSRAGAMRCGGRVRGTAWGFAFHVDVLPSGGGTTSEIWLRAGSGRSGQRIRSFGASALQCVIDRARPAHTVAIYRYAAPRDPDFLFDFTT